MLAPPAEPPEPLLIPPAIVDMPYEIEETPTVAAAPEKTSSESHTQNTDKEETDTDPTLTVEDATDITIEKPDASTHAGENTHQFFHICSTDETVEGIAKKYSVSVDKIRELNKLVGSNPPQGRVLLLPRDRNNISSAKDITTYTIIRGDTYSSISRRYKINTYALMYLNNADTPLLQIDDVLYVPDVVRQ
jgi:LysM repeat protein